VNHYVVGPRILNLLQSHPFQRIFGQNGYNFKVLSQKIIFKILIIFCCIHLKIVKWQICTTLCWRPFSHIESEVGATWFWIVTTWSHPNKQTNIYTYKQTPILLNICVFSAKIGHFSNKKLKNWLSIVWFCNICLVMRNGCFSWYITTTLGNDTYMSIVLHEGKG
jgi:hypothetical protein